MLGGITVVLTFSISALATAAPHAAPQDPLPTFTCTQDPIRPNECAFFSNIQTTKENPHFEPHYRTPEEISGIIVENGKYVTFTSDICNYFPNVEQIIIWNATLEDFQPNAFENCRNLNAFSVYWGLFNEIPDNLFKDVADQLTGIVFDETPIREIKADQFHGLAKLSFLQISSSQIDNFPVESIVDSTNLDGLVLYSNNLNDFAAETIIERFPQILELGYSDNDIKCSRVEELNKFLNSKGVEIDKSSTPKSREGQVDSVGGVICVP